MSKYRIANFWIRLVAFLIDVLVLGILGFFLGLLFSNFFIKLGGYGVVVGFVISIIYFTVCNSKLVGGQTVGKRLFKLKVVGSSDTELSIKSSLIRSLILTFPYFFINCSIPGLPAYSIVPYICSTILAILLIGLFYYYIFNKSTRQSLHDIVVKSYVVETEELTEQFERAFLKPVLHYGYSAVAVALLVISVISYTLNNSIPDDLNQLQEKLNAIDGVVQASVSLNTTSYWGSNKKTTQLNCSIVVAQECNNVTLNTAKHDEFQKKIVSAVLDNYLDKDKLDALAIQFVWGYNIGIYKSSNSISFSKTPNEWLDTTK